MPKFLLSAVMVFLFTGNSQAENYLKLDSYRPANGWKIIGSAVVDQQHPGGPEPRRGSIHALEQRRGEK